MDSLTVSSKNAVKSKGLQNMCNELETLFALLTILGRYISVNSVKIDNEWFARQIFTSLTLVILNELRPYSSALRRRLGRSSPPIGSRYSFSMIVSGTVRDAIFSKFRG
jgi:hypothetical protein